MHQPSQEFEHDDGVEDVIGEGLDMEDVGFQEESGTRGRTGNYTNAEDKLICTAWKKMGA